MFVLSTPPVASPTPLVSESLQAKLFAYDAATNDYGCAVALSSEHMAIGAENDNDVGASSGEWRYSSLRH